MTARAQELAKLRLHAEIWSRRLIGHQLGLETLSPDDVSTYEAWCREDCDLTFNKWRTGASLNHGECVRAACLRHPDRDLSMAAERAMRLELRVQLGYAAPPDAPAPTPMMRYWGGYEMLSSDYDEKRHWSVAALWLWSMDASSAMTAEAREDARNLCAEYFEVTGAAYALGASPLYDRACHLNAKGRPYYDGPALSTVGGRANHRGQDEREVIFCKLAGVAAEWQPSRYPDALPVIELLERALAARDGSLALPSVVEAWADASNGDPRRCLEILERTRLMVPMHFGRYDKGVVSWIDVQPTRLSPSYVAWSYTYEDGRAEVGFPFEEGSKNRGRGLDYEPARAVPSAGFIVVTGGTAAASPVPSPPGVLQYRVDWGPEGIVASGGGHPAAPPEDDRPPAEEKKRRRSWLDRVRDLF